MIKTIVLTGAEAKVTDLGGQNVAIKNLGAGSVYASAFPNIVAGADNVIEIPAESGETLLDARGTVYLLGSGKVQLTGTSYPTPNFKMPSSSSGGGGGTGDVTKAYVDAQDTTNLAVAKAYTDTEVSAVKDDVTKNADDISALKSDVTEAQGTADTAQSTADEANAAAATAQSTADTNTGNISALQSAVASAQADIAGNTAAIAGHTSDIGALQFDLSTAKSDIAAAQTDIIAADTKAENANTRAAAAESKAEAAQSSIDEIADKSVVSEDGAFGLRFNDDKLQAKAGDEWTDITTGGGTTGGVSQAYVDTRDADTLTNAKTYTDSKITPLQINVEGNTEDISDLKSRVTETEGAIDKLNGTGDGSVKKIAADKVAEIVDDAPESYNSLKKISEWINEHPEDTAAMNAQIQQNKQDIADINNEATGILAKAERYTDEQLSPVNNSIANLQAGKANKTDIPTTLPANGGNADTVGGHTVMTNVPENANFTAPNQNLLDNWYFADPINQRGETTYLADGYTIDRWATYTITGKPNVIISKEDKNIQISNTLPSGVCNLYQIFENIESLTGKTVTVSVLADDTLYSVTFTMCALSGGGEIIPNKLEVYSISDYHILFRTVAGTTVNLQAAKLELGGKQTLAHEENGKVVLNDPPPNKALELAKCQRYYIPLGQYLNIPAVYFGVDYVDFVLSLPCTMKKSPTIGGNLIVIGSVRYHDFNFSVIDTGATFLRIRASKTGHGLSNEHATVISVEKGGAYLDAED